jgi:hypothetical protein
MDNATPHEYGGRHSMSVCRTVVATGASTGIGPAWGSGYADTGLASPRCPTMKRACRARRTTCRQPMEPPGRRVDVASGETETTGRLGKENEDASHPAT